MKVTVRLVGGLIHTVGFSERELEVPPGTTAAGLIAELGIDLRRPLIVARGGWAIDLDDEVREADRIMISPVFSGG